MSQLFKIPPSKILLYDFLNDSGHKEVKYYIFSKTYFKSSCLKNKIAPFVQKLRECYFPSKLFYIDRKLTYKSFATILRQICKVNKIPIHSDIKYNKSAYQSIQQSVIDLEGILKIGLSTVSFTSLITQS